MVCLHHISGKINGFWLNLHKYIIVWWKKTVKIASNLDTDQPDRLNVLGHDGRL